MAKTQWYNKVKEMLLCLRIVKDVLIAQKWKMDIIARDTEQILTAFIHVKNGVTKKNKRGKNMAYIKSKGILVGTYNETDLAMGKVKEDVKKVSEETGYKYTNTELVKKNGNIVGIKVYVCSMEDFKI